MNCEEMRGLLTADYIDGELDEGARGEVVEHLAACTRCRQFKEAVRCAAVEPFRHAQLSSAPASVWHKVARRIDQERGGGVRVALRRGWERLFTIRKAVYAAASLAVVSLIVAFLVRVPSTAGRGARLSSGDVEGVHDYMKEQFIALEYQGNNGAESPVDGDMDYDGIVSVNFGTIVEKYLI